MHRAASAPQCPCPSVRCIPAANPPAALLLCSAALAAAPRCAWRPSLHHSPCPLSSARAYRFQCTYPSVVSALCLLLSSLSRSLEHPFVLLYRHNIIRTIVPSTTNFAKMPNRYINMYRFTQNCTIGVFVFLILLLWGMLIEKRKDKTI